MKIEKELMQLNQHFKTKEEAIRASGELLVQAGYVEPSYIDAMLERNQLVSTHMGNFIAIPHGTEDAKKYVKKSGISLIQVPKGVNFGTAETSNLAMIIFGIAGVGNKHIELLQTIALFCSDIKNVMKLADAQSIEEIQGLLEGVTA